LYAEVLKTCTPERKARQSALFQNWKPWDSSTGAKSAEGKAVSAKNAFKGGWQEELRQLSAMLKEQKETMHLIR